ncbi:MAG: 23S rRNA pseudouridine(1911/1915/1917) synthase RluD [Oceanococcus sp.]
MQFEVSVEKDGTRLDKLLAELLPEHSRARIQSWIKQGRVQVDGQQLPAKTRLQFGSRIQMQPVFEPDERPMEPQAIDFGVLYEDDDILIVNKPAGLTVHPGAGQPDGTLQNGLLHYRPALAQVARAGIVHRLDKDTSGVMIVAATPQAQTQLVRDLQERNIQREYVALVWGTPVAGSTIDQPLGRHPRERIRFSVRPGGRDAVTHFRVAEKFYKHARLQVTLETGRTHQIRVHMQHQGYPLIGDPLYGRRGDPYRATLGRQALHAVKLQLTHPRTGEDLSFEAAIPADMQSVLDEWRSELA